MSLPGEPLITEVDIQDTKSPQEIADDAAVALVKADAESFEAWIEGQQWNEAWRTIDVLYDSPRQFGSFEGSQTQKSAVNRFILCQHVNSLHPKFTEGLFYDDQYFQTVPYPGADNNAVRARSTVLRQQLKDMDFENEVDRGVFQLILHGTGIWKWGLCREEECFYTYERAGAPLTQAGPMGNTITLDTEESFTYKEVEHKRSVIKPFFENKEIRGILVDPKCKLPDIRKAKVVIDKYYLNLAELMDLAKDPNYTLPSEETLKQWLEEPKEQAAILGNMDTQPGSPTLAGQGAPDWNETSQDPYQDTLMVLERWDNYKVITTLNNKVCIQNKANPYGVVPYYSANFYNRIRSFWGVGDGKIVGTDQRLQQGLENAGIALLQLILDPPFVTNEDQIVLTQNMRLRKGGNIKVKGDIKTAIGPLQMPNLPLGELFAFLQQSKSAAEAADGVNEMFTSGSMPGPGTGGKSSATRSATGVTAISAANASRLMGPVGRFCNQVFVPWIYQLDLLNRRFIMTTPEGVQQFKTVLGEQYSDYKFDGDAFLNTKVDFDVLAGAHLAAKKIMAQALPVLTSIIENPNLQEQLVQYTGEAISVKELLMMWLESTGWRNTKSLFIKAQQPPTPEQNKATSAVQLQQLKGQQAEDLQDKKATTGMARDAVKATLTSEGNKKDMLDQAEQEGAERILRQADVKAPQTLGGEE